ncbi:cytochrome P450 [Microbacterium sp. No. 7]|uniref:cytochrome P450 n=1 Tax=Microbacterium sp. No. 7 TaxID=1714373 RepID=UPI000A5C1412|nr:cytochrome P450 [Microbacterium sp. No. 7]
MSRRPFLTPPHRWIEAYLPQLHVYWITRWDDVAESTAEKEPWISGWVEGGPNSVRLARSLGQPVITLVGGDVHKDLRVGVDRTLQPRPITRVVEESIRPIARAHISELVAKGSADLVSEYFEPVSVEALRHVMGLDPYVDAETLVRWFKQLAGGAGNVMNDPEIWEQNELAAREIEDLLLPILDELSGKAEEETMLSHMLWAGRTDGTPRDKNAILSTVKIILLGGMQEPGHAASSTALGLYESGQWGLLREDGAKWIPQAVLEGLRWIAPIGTTGRTVARDHELHGVTIPKHAGVEMILASANRDEKYFSRPDVFDIERNEKDKHQAFGGGQHFCAGHFFGRQVERIMFEELLAATKDVSLTPGAPVENVNLSWAQGGNLNGTHPVVSGLGSGPR